MSTTLTNATDVVVASSPPINNKAYPVDNSNESKRTTKNCSRAAMSDIGSSWLSVHGTRLLSGLVQSSSIWRVHKPQRTHTLRRMSEREANSTKVRLNSMPHGSPTDRM